MVSTFQDKFKKDLELIYAKYTNPFDGAPELTLSTCDLPENVQLIENYSKCGKWTVLGGSRDMYADDISSDENNLVTSDEEEQFSCYDSDKENSSNCSFSFETSFRDKYPRSCVKRTSETPSMNSISTCGKSHIEARSKNLLVKPIVCDEQFKMQETVTLSKDLWSQVQQCLRLMTSVFSQLNSECGDECDNNVSQYQIKQSLVQRSCVKQRLFDGDNAADIPKGQSVEKLIVRQKGSRGPGIELATRKNFLHESTGKIFEIENLDSGFCQENSIDDFINSTSSKTTKLESIYGSCSESLYKKKNLKASTKSTTGYQVTSNGGDLSSLPQSSQNHNQLTQGLPVKKRRRYRLVRRMSSKTKSTSNDTTESELNTSKLHDAARNEHSFDQCLSDSDESHMYESTKKIVDCDNPQSESISSPEMHEVILVAAPSTPVVQKSMNCHQEISKNTTSRSSLYTSSPPQRRHRSSTPCRIPGGQISLHTTSNIKEQYRSSTPRKHIEMIRGGKNYHDECLKKLVFTTSNNLSADSMPSPIRSTVNNKHHSEMSSSSKIESTADSLVKSINTQSASSTLIPEISVNFLGPKEIVERSSLVKDNRTKHKISLTKDKYACSKKSCSTLPEITGLQQCHIPPVDHSKQEGKHSDLPCNNEDENLFFKGTGSSNSASTARVNFHTAISEPRNRGEQCYTDDTRSKTTPHSKRSRTTIDTLKSDVNASDNYQQSPPLKITPRRRKFHPYATDSKFPRKPSFSPSSTVRSSLISPFRDLAIKSPSLSSYKWTTLGRSPMAICFKQARRMSDPVIASRKILNFGSHNSQKGPFNPCSEKTMTEQKCQSRSREGVRNDTVTDSRCEGDDSRLNCLNGKCTKTFCFNCSMDLS